MAQLGRLSAATHPPPELPWLALAVVMGGALGAQLGSRWFPAPVIVRILGVTPW